jgi:hypothetical protein
MRADSYKIGWLIDTDKRAYEYMLVMHVSNAPLLIKHERLSDPLDYSDTLLIDTLLISFLAY